MGDILAILLQGAGIGALATAASADLKARIIPDELTLWVAILGLGARACSDGWTSWESVLLAAGVVVVLGFLSRRNVMGGGDAKMIAAATLLFKPGLAPLFLLCTAVAGGALSIGYLTAFSVVRPSSGLVGPSLIDAPAPLGIFGSERARIAAREPLPYGLAILAGGAFVFLREAFRFLPATSS
jgi:prepilin peptidase CpaA